MELLGDDARRIENLPVWKALRNPNSSADFVAEKLNLEPHQVHISRCQSNDTETHYVSTVSGKLMISGVTDFNFQLTIQTAK